MLCANRTKIPEDAGSFVGFATLPDGNGPGFRVRSRKKCSDALSGLKLNPEDGRPYKPNSDLTWFEDFKDECEVALLYSGLPIRLGNLVGPRPRAADSEGAAIHSPQLNGSSGRPPKPGYHPGLATQMLPSSHADMDMWAKRPASRAGVPGRPPSGKGAQARRRKPTPEQQGLQFLSRPSSASPVRSGTSSRPGSGHRPHSLGSKPSPLRSAASSGPGSGASSACSSPLLRPRSSERLSRWRCNPLRLSDPSH